MQELIFFDKDGYAFNFHWNKDVEKFEGKLLFHENSNETFKTLIINVFERIRPFEYSQGNDLDLVKWQLFNEHGFFFLPKKFINEDITNIEKVNNAATFFSKWIYGQNFEVKFPVGSLVKFTGTGISDFTSGVTVKPFYVVSSKKGAIMVITATNNAAYSSPFTVGQISSVNAVQIYDYSSVSSWSQPGFDTALYTDRKISIVGSEKNDGVYTVDTTFLNTKNTPISYIPSTSLSTLTTAQDFLRVEIKLLTDRIFVTTQSVNFEANRQRIIFADGIPENLKNGVDFIFDSGVISNLNLTYTATDKKFPIWNNTATYNLNEVVEYFGNFFRSNVASNVGNLPNGSFWIIYNINYDSNASYFSGNIVKYQNAYYRCLTNVSGVLPSNMTYWSTILLNLYIQQTPNNEGPVVGTVYLTTATLDFDQPFVNSNIETLITFSTKYKKSFASYNLDLYVDATDKLNVRNKIPENFASVNFYTYKKVGTIYTSINITLNTSVNNYLIPLKETLKLEGGFKEGYFSNEKEISDLIRYSIDFINIDSFGLHITINGLEYSVPFDTNALNTLSDWVTLYASTLAKIGIIVTNIGTTLSILTSYPNVPLVYSIKLGTTGIYRIKHSDITFVDPNPTFNQLKITINGLDYLEPFDTSITTTISNWVNRNKYVLLTFGIVVTSLGDTLNFYTEQQNTLLTYNIFTGNKYIDTRFEYIITKLFSGHLGIVMASNQIVNTNIGVNLQDYGFATAMILHLKNSVKPLNNQEYNVLLLDPLKMILSYQGPFWDDNTINLDITTREFLRQPRFGFDNDPQAKIVFKWQDDTTPELFLYDFSGKFLENTGPFSYTGILPLVDVTTEFLPDHQLGLIDKPNRDLEKRNLPKAQQTVFDEVSFPLDLIDSNIDLSLEPEALPIFIGFNDPNEGPTSNTLKMYFVENRSMTVTTDPLTSFDILTFVPSSNQIQLTSSTLYFKNFGFTPGQIISILGFDNTNQYNQAKLANNGKKFYIKSVFSNILVIDPEKSDIMLAESTLTSIVNHQPPFNNIPTGMTVKLNVEPKEIGSFQIYGETETEDVRHRITLDNVGHNIKHRDVYIFKDYDIYEEGVDWTYLNRKRKEMLLVQPEIFNYIGSYRAVVNAINYFGYNDLTLYEYYRNINADSHNYKKLHKLEIPDIFDTTVKGWNEKDYLRSTLPNKNYKKTNLFNLTYRITDFEGNNILGYSLDEAIVKLSGLKRWLKENVLPIGTRILDITGRVDSRCDIGFQHSSNFERGIKTSETFSPVVFKVEGYKQPVSNGSSLYSLHLDFSTADGVIPSVWSFNIKTYETHPMWNVTKNYIIGNKITYFGRIYRSLLTPNEGILPNIDANYWIEEDFKLVQRISEQKVDLNSYNFSADRDADAFIVIEAFSDNSYGANYSFSKFVTLDGIWLLTQKLDPATMLNAFDAGYNSGFGA